MGIATVQIAAVNESTVVSEGEFASAIIELEAQINRDFAPIWNMDAKITIFENPKDLPPTSWWFIILDTADVAGALGYHELTNYGLPIGKVFAKTTKDYGGNWTMTASHELLEMMVDPYISEVAFDQQTNTAGTLYAYEVCDAVEDDAQGYTINGVRLSDFVYPAWFESTPVVGARFDFMNVLKKPFELAPGGYISLFKIGKKIKGWEQAWGKARTAEPITSTDRTALRPKPYSEYKNSTR